MENNTWMTSTHTMLRDELAMLYLEKEDAVRIATEAGINVSDVYLDSSPANNWFAVIKKAESQEKLVLLVERAQNAHLGNKTLENVLGIFKGSLGSSVSPGDEDVQEIEVEGVNLPRVQKEGGYIIDEPPADWVVKELTLREHLQSTFGTDLARDDSGSPFIDADRIDNRDILIVCSETQLNIEFDPGVSLICGRPTLSFIPEQIPIAQLKIMPMDRSVPPSYVEQTLEHIFMLQLNQFLPLTNLKSCLASTTRKTNRLRLTAELDQSIDHVSVNGTPNQGLTTNITVIGIQGYARDYLLVLSYVSQATSNKREIAKQIALLQSLVDSFKLIKPANIEELDLQFRDAGDKRFKKFVEQSARPSILGQSQLFIARWVDLNWDITDSCTRVISDARLIQKAVEAFKVQIEETDSLLQLLDQIPQMTPDEIRELFVPGEEEKSEAH